MDVSIELGGGVLASMLCMLAYWDLRTRGRHGWLRFFAFWGGFPVTLVIAGATEEGARARIDRPEADDDLDALLADVRRDREGREERRLPRGDPGPTPAEEGGGGSGDAGMPDSGPDAPSGTPRGEGR